MKKGFIGCLAAAFAVFLCTSVLAAELISAPSEARKHELFAPVFRTAYVDGDPDDPVKMDLRVTFTAPSGKTTVVPAFLTGRDRAENASFWEARFVPEEEGEYLFSAKNENIPDRHAKAVSPAVFRVSDTSLKGFLKRSSNNPRYLKFSSGEPFFGLGHNVAWVHNSSPEVFGRYFSLLKEAGCNLARVWICDWSLPLECGMTGNYDRVSSQKLDRILELASDNGIYIILCLDTYGSLVSGPGFWREGRWSQNPYNAANGGPCEHPEDMFTEPEAIRMYKNKLRYVAARWGFSPAILAFELWNEYNAPRGWTRQMASYLRSIGREGKLVTTSLGYPSGKKFDEDAIWRFDELDIVTSHFYGTGREGGLVNPLVQKSLEIMKSHNKPFIISEFGIDNSKDDRYYDSRGDGRALHNSIWASALSGSLGSAMNWWHDSYIRPKALYRHYSALARFLEGINWDSEDVSSPEVSLVFYRRGEPAARNRDVFITPVDKWGMAGISEYEVIGNGDLAGGGMPVKYLHGSEKAEMRTDQLYKVNYAGDGEFVIRVGTVSQGGHLNVFLDDVKIFEKAFPAGSGKGPWKMSRKLKEYGVYQCVYDEDVSVKIPAGEHHVRLSNTGKDWIGIEKIKLGGYIAGNVANARCIAWNVGGVAMFWIHNAGSTWRAGYEGKDPEPVKRAFFEVYDMDPGSYTLEIWNTYEGRVISSRKVRALGGKIRISLPEFSNDIACKLIPSSE
jgi:hypothetical protein